MNCVETVCDNRGQREQVKQKISEFCGSIVNVVRQRLYTQSEKPGKQREADTQNGQYAQSLSGLEMPKANHGKER